MTKDDLLFRVHGQREAAQAVVDEIPEAFFESPTTTFADLAMGGGQYLAEVLRRCEKYHSREQILPRLFGFEKSRVYINCALDYNGLDGACISTESPFELTMKFDVIVGNPPYQAPKAEDRRGPGGDNSLFLKFIRLGVELLNPNGFISMVTPPSAFTKSTVNGQPTKTLQTLMKAGALTSLNLDAGSFFNVGTSISRWTFSHGAKQDNVTLVKDGVSYEIPVKDIFFCPPEFEWVEFRLFNKIVSNREGTPLNVTRDKPDRDFTMKRLGYPKIQRGGSNALGFDAEHADFLLSQLGLWLLHFIRRHDQFMYHKLLTGIHVPSAGFVLSDEEKKFIESRHWPNFSVAD